jgi:riboflavin synthase
MFTGIVEKTARIARMASRGNGAVLAIQNPWPTPPESGESISVSGACLTVVSANEREISFDVSAETLQKTILGSIRPGGKVNLEKALRVSDDISGHFVAGHVDGVGEVTALRRQDAFAELVVRAPEDLAVYLVPKGSVAVDGVSLTIATLKGSAFSIAVIPETLARTTLGELTPGTRVNIETDMLGKYVVKYLSQMGGADRKPSGLTIKRLEELGF